MASSTKIGSREYGLILGSVILRYLSNSRSLHYGYWEPGLEVNITNLGKAQDAYTQFLLSNLPKGAKTVLDVGCGTGAVARQLIDAGYEVEALSPSAILNEEARKLCPEITIHDCGFQDFETNFRYDVLLFSESFQYIPMLYSFSRSKDMLTAGSGRMVVFDKFPYKDRGKSPIGGGHDYNSFLSHAELFKYTIEENIDVAERIAPTFDLLNDVMQNLARPLYEKFDDMMGRSRPRLAGILRWLFAGRIRRFREQLSTSRDGQGFLDYNSYRVLTIRPPEAETSG